MLQLRILRISFCSVQPLMRYVHSCPVETSLILKIVQLAPVFSILLIIPISEEFIQVLDTKFGNLWP
jgi:hypothetical protein